MRSNLIDYRKVQKITLDGFKFDSKAEVQFYLWLKARVQAKEILDIRKQVKVELLPGDRKHRIDYYVDFAFTIASTNQQEYNEVKGFQAPAWKLKLKLWRHFGPGVLKIYQVGWGGKFTLIETVYPAALKTVGA